MYFFVHYRRDGVAVGIFDHLMEVILEIFRNDHARKEGEDIFNKFRVYLFIEIRDFKVRIFALMFHTSRKHTYMILTP